MYRASPCDAAWLFPEPGKGRQRTCEKERLKTLPLTNKYLFTERLHRQPFLLNLRTPSLQQVAAVRHDVKTTARAHETRLVSDLERAEQYHQAARAVAAEAKDRSPQFTDKERINLEIYAERQNDESEREKYLDLARGHEQSHDREVSLSISR